MIEPTGINVYDWEDIEEDICNRMEMQPELFRNYHKLVGGSYKDLWHVAREVLIPDTVASDTIVRLYGFLNKREINKNVKDYGEWSRKFFVAYDSLMKELDPNDDGVFVYFSW